MKFVLAPIRAKVLKDYTQKIHKEDGDIDQRYLSLLISDERKDEILKVKCFKTFGDGDILIDKEIVFNTMTITPYDFGGRSGVSYSIESSVIQAQE